VYISDLDPEVLRVLTQRKVVDYLRRRRAAALPKSVTWYRWVVGIRSISLCRRRRIRPDSPPTCSSAGAHGIVGHPGGRRELRRPSTAAARKSGPLAAQPWCAAAASSSGAIRETMLTTWSLPSTDAWQRVSAGSRAPRATDSRPVARASYPSSKVISRVEDQVPAGHREPKRTPPDPI
jgi:hypothetical protein